MEIAITMLVGYALFGFLIAGWNYGRGNSFILGLFLGLIFTPIVSFLFVALTSKNEKKLEKRAVKSGKMKKCPKCAEVIRSEATKCRYCGSDI